MTILKISGTQKTPFFLKYFYIQGEIFDDNETTSRVSFITNLLFPDETENATIHRNVVHKTKNTKSDRVLLVRQYLRVMRFLLKYKT